jgi:hypothetical protein
MIPSKAWYPSSLQERAAWYDNFVTNLTPIATTLGVAPAALADLVLDNEDFQSIAATTLAVENFKSAVREYRISLTEGSTGDPHPMFPFSNFNGPQNDRPAGMFQRLVEMVERIRVHPAYTDEIGASLGILPQVPQNLTPDQLKPEIKASQSMNGYKFAMTVTRMGMPQFKVQMQRDGATTWSDVAFGTSSPIEVTVSPTNAGQPERVLVRAVLLEKNAPVGEPSDPTFVTVNP